MGLADGLPSGLYTGAGIERYLHEVLSEPGRTDDFGELGCELYLTATDLDSCERVVLGVDGSRDVPISTAVRASGALPMVYAPVRVHDRELIDGGIVSTTNLDLAIQAGAKLVVVINPIVPFVNDFSQKVNTLRGKRPRRVSDMGFAQIGYQVFKLVAHQRLHELAKGWEQRYPGVDIVLIEPEANDELMFETSMMSFTSRVEIARHGFESVTKQLAGEYDALRRGRRAPRPRNLRQARAQSREALRRAARVGERLAQDPRGHHRRAAAPGRLGRLEELCRSRPGGDRWRPASGWRCARARARRGRRRRRPARRRAPGARRARHRRAWGGRPTRSWPGCRRPRSRCSRSAAVSRGRSWKITCTRRSISSEQLCSASNAPAWEISETPRSGASSASSSPEPGAPIA